MKVQSTIDETGSIVAVDIGVVRCPASMPSTLSRYGPKRTLSDSCLPQFPAVANNFTSPLAPQTPTSSFLLDPLTTTAQAKMADMDTYNDEQRGYEGNYTYHNAFGLRFRGYSMI